MAIYAPILGGAESNEQGCSRRKHICDVSMLSKGGLGSKQDCAEKHARLKHDGGALLWPAVAENAGELFNEAIDFGKLLGIEPAFSPTTPQGALGAGKGGILKSNSKVEFTQRKP